MSDLLQSILPQQLLHAALRRRNALRAKFGGRAWAERDFAPPSPDHIKHRVLLRNGFPNATWIETGTYLGDTTAQLSKNAKHVYSIEPEPKLFESAKKRFASKGNVTIVHGTSEQQFPGVLEKVSGDVNFWLDGHYSAGLTFKGATDTPIAEELKAVGRSLKKFGKVAVLVDDVSCFHPSHPSSASYPPIDFLVDWAREHGLVWHIEHDIFVAKSR